MQLLNQKEPQAPVFNLTANFEGAIPIAGIPQGLGEKAQQQEEDEDEFELDISDVED